MHYILWLVEHTTFMSRVYPRLKHWIEIKGIGPILLVEACFMYIPMKFYTPVKDG